MRKMSKMGEKGRVMSPDAQYATNTMGKQPIRMMNKIPDANMKMLKMALRKRKMEKQRGR